jgi:hypothetical protein
VDKFYAGWRETLLDALMPLGVMPEEIETHLEQSRQLLLDYMTSGVDIAESVKAWPENRTIAWK